LGNGDLSTDLSLGILTLASSVRPLEGQATHPDAEGKDRRRPRRELEPEEENGEANSAASDTADPSPHQLDSLA
jgi:hypothetical protein